MNEHGGALISALTARFESDQRAGAGGDGMSLTERRVVAVLERIGWRSASDEAPEEIAGDIVMMLQGCVRGHRVLAALRRDLAEYLRRHADPLDGSLASVSAWEPTAAELIQRYADGEPA